MYMSSCEYVQNLNKENWFIITCDTTLLDWKVVLFFRLNPIHWVMVVYIQLQMKAVDAYA